MQNSTVSIIVPIYNSEQYLRECVDSILAQTYSDIEVLLVDDGSADACGSICDGYALSDTRVTVFHQKNKGQSAAKNLGISKASGSFLYFADSDDILHARLIESLYTCMAQYDADIVQCRHGRNEELLERSVDIQEPILLSPVEALKSLHDAVWHFDSTVMWTKLFRKELFNGLAFAQLTYHEDFDLTYRLFYRAHRIAFINSVLYYYRPSGTSLTDAAFSLRKLDAVTASEKKYEFMAALGNTELTDKTLQGIADLYFLFYFKCRWYVPESPETYALLLKKSRKIYGKTIRAAYIPLKSKIKYTIFVLFPNVLYTVVRLTRGKFIISFH